MLEQEQSKAIAYRPQYTLLALFAGVNFVRVNLWIAPAPLMAVIMGDLSITYGQSGMLLTTVTLFMGVFLLVGSAVIDKLGNTAALKISMVCLVLDGAIVYLTKSYAMMLLGCVMNGIAHGLSGGAIASLVLERYEPRRHGVVNSINTAVNGVSTAAVYIITVPLYRLLNSWRTVMLLWSFAAVLLFLWFQLYDRRNRRPLKLTPAPEADLKKEKSSLQKAARIREVWFFTVAMVGAFFVYNALVAYLPSYLTSIQGFSAELAGIATGLMSVGGILGGLSCGAISVRITRKNLMIAWIFLFTALADAGMVLFSNRILICICIFVAGIGFSGWLPVSLTAIMQLKGMTPRLIGGANAIYLSIGSLATFVVPPLFQGLQSLWGMQTALLLFGLSMIPSLLSMLLFPKDP